MVDPLAELSCLTRRSRGVKVCASPPRISTFTIVEWIVGSTSTDPTAAVPAAFSDTSGTTPTKNGAIDTGTFVRVWLRS